MNILVTGGAGFIGSHTVVELLEQGYTPIIVDDFRNSNRSVIDNIEKITQKRPVVYDFDCGDASLLDTIFKEHRIDGIIHFAAYKAVGESVRLPLKYYHNNIGSLVTVLEMMQKHNVKNIVFSSSCTVYGDTSVVPVKETQTLGKAESPYGYTKQVCERILMDYNNANRDTSVSILRYFNPIGAHPSGLIGELPIGIPNNLVPFITQTAIGEREQLTVFGNDYNTPDGTCIRDYIHVVDLAKAHIKALEKLVVKNKDTNNVDIYNIGTGKGVSVLEVIETFEKSTGTKLNYRIGNRRSGDVEKVFADTNKVSSELNWHSIYSLSDCLKHAWKWQKNISGD